MHRAITGKAFRMILLCGVPSILLPLSLPGTQDKEISLLERSPFKIAKSEELVSKVDNMDIPLLSEDLEFCGAYNSRIETIFSILTKSDGKQKWYAIGDEIGDLEIVDYIPDQRALVFQKNGSNHLLALHEKSVIVTSSNKDRVLSEQRVKPQNTGTETRKKATTKARPPRRLPAAPSFPSTLPPPPAKA